MAKKKVQPKEDEELDDFDEEVVDSHYPEISKTSAKEKEAEVDDSEELTEEDAEADEFEFEMEEEAEVLTYKYVDLEISKKSGENDYVIIVKGQSHGFLNILVKHLLETEGVNAAAYKVTRVNPPEIFIRIDKKYKIKDILSKGIEGLRSEVTEVQEVFEKLMK